jgi:hypothetical protein
MISIPLTSNITTSRTLMHMDHFTHDAYIEDEDFKEVFKKLHGQICVEEGDRKVDYHLHNGLLYKLDNLHVPKCERLQLILGAQNSIVA